MPDLDQSGTFRQAVRVYLGPSIGWTTGSLPMILPVTTGGTTVISFGTSLVRVNVNAAVTIVLPPAKGNAAGPGAVPTTWVQQPITVCDVGGFARTGNITILPAGSDLIAGQGSLVLTSAYSLVTLIPNVTAGNWSYSI